MGKRKSEQNDSVATSSSSKPKRSPRSSSKKTQTMKRRQSEVDEDDSGNEKDIFSTYSIRKLLKADTTLNAGNLQISSDAANLIGKAASVFMAELLRGSVANSKNDKLEYDDIAAYIDSEDNLSFLSDIVPKRVVFSEVQRTEVKGTPMDTDDTEKHSNSKDKAQRLAQNVKTQMTLIYIYLITVR